MRPAKEEYYLNIAKAVSGRSTCIRRKVGAIAVKDDVIISTGYNGSPRNEKNCIETGICLGNKLKIPPGKRYDICRAVHA
ncbi:MAG: hypothetical protein QXP53_02295 [Candidatus Pacearchaeota archaeon]